MGRPGRAAAGPLRGGARADGGRRPPREPRRRPASTARRSTSGSRSSESARTSSTRRSRSSTTRSAVGLRATTPRARRGSAWRSSTSGTHRRRHPRPPHGGRGRRRRRPATRVEPAFAWGPVARHLGLRRRRDGGDAAAEVDGPAADSSVAALVAGVERGLLVSDFWYTRVLDPRTPRRHRPDPQRRVADRGRRGHRAGAATSASPSPTPQALMPGQRARRRAHGDAGPRRHLHGDVAALVVPGAAPGVVELHRRRLRLTARFPARSARVSDGHDPQGLDRSLDVGRGHRERTGRRTVRSHRATHDQGGVDHQARLAGQPWCSSSSRTTAAGSSSCAPTLESS